MKDDLRALASGQDAGSSMRTLAEASSSSAWRDRARGAVLVIGR